MEYDPSIQSISWFVARYRDGGLQIKPPYQRKPVWASKQKCYLIESVLLKLPIPEIYMQVTVSPDGDSTYAIVDGQQRIRTVLQFVGVDADEGEQEHNEFALDKLSSESPWRNKSFGDLTDDEKRAFYEYRFTVRTLKTNSDAEVRDMFKRLNKYLSALKPQELRNATYTGPFMQLALEFANAEYWAENRIVTAAAIRRMMDVEFVSELLIGVLHGPQAGSPKVIDSYYEKYEDCVDQFPEQRTAKKLFEKTLAAIEKILPSVKDCRWGNKTDFYTVFVAVASLLREQGLVSSKIPTLRKALLKLADKVNKRLADEKYKVPRNVSKYVRAVEKGVNDKKRRADRHAVVVALISKYFKTKK